MQGGYAPGTNSYPPVPWSRDPCPSSSDLSCGRILTFPLEPVFPCSSYLLVLWALSSPEDEQGGAHLGGPAWHRGGVTEQLGTCSWKPGFVTYSCVRWDMLLNFCVPQLPHLLQRGDNGTYLTTAVRITCIITCMCLERSKHCIIISYWCC